MRDGSGWFCSLSLSRSLPCFYPNYFLKIIFELFSVMTQNYLFSQEIANVLPGFVSVVLLFIPWSSIPHSVPYGVDVAEGFLLPSDTFNGIFALPLFFSIPHYSLLLLFSFSFDFLSSLSFHFVLSCRCPATPLSFQLLLVFKSQPGRKQEWGEARGLCAGEQEGSQEPEVAKLTRVGEGPIHCGCNQKI